MKDIPRNVGLVAASHTPFHADGSLNLAIFEKRAEHLLNNEVQHVFVSGSTGECHSLRVEERCALVQQWVEAAHSTPMRVIVHVGSNWRRVLAFASVKTRALQKTAASIATPIAIESPWEQTKDRQINNCRNIAFRSAKERYFRGGDTYFLTNPNT